MEDEMTLSARNQEIAERLIEARRQGTLWTPSFDESFTVADGYLVQERIGAALGWFAGGAPKAWKAGGKEVMTGAPLPPVLTSPATWSGAGQHGLVIEAELAFRLARTPEQGQDIESCLGTMCVTIEIIATRMAGGMNAPVAWKLADQLLHAALVVGTEVPYVPRDWDKQSCRVMINGATQAEAQGTHPSGHPLLPLPWLLDHAATRRDGLRAGDLVTTGAWIVLPAQRGDTVDVEFDGIGAARVRIIA
jgi:2-keto-4-pentenoate hydratase